MCTRALWVADSQPVLVGRSMDWVERMGTKVRIMPRGMTRRGYGGAKPLTWRSRYGSVVAAVWGSVVADGMNEEGLNANALWLDESEFGPRDYSRPGLSAALWVQYYLDNYSTVADAIAATRKIGFQVRPFSLVRKGEKKESLIHLSLADASGNSAIVELLTGKAAIHQGKQHTVMTNSPTYKEHLVLMKQYEGLGGKKPLPGTCESEDRFARAAHYLRRLPAHPDCYQEAVAGILSVMHSVATPLHEDDLEGPGSAMTHWISVSDTTNHIYHFNFSTSLNLVSITLDNLGLSHRAQPAELDLRTELKLNGDVSERFQSIDPKDVIIADEC